MFSEYIRIAFCPPLVLLLMYVMYDAFLVIKWIVTSKGLQKHLIPYLLTMHYFTSALFT